MENELKDLAVSIFEVNAVKFGDFVTKVGLKTPVYIDLRVIIGYPKLFHRVSTVLWKHCSPDSSTKIDQICGVPYTALPIASLISVESNIPMLIRRKEVKKYGTKKLIEGVFVAGNTCIIIEDVVTSGSSILETVLDLKEEGLNVIEAIVLMDREQGGKKNIEGSGIKMKSLFTLSKLMEYLFEAGKVTSDTVDSVLKYIKECNAPLKISNKESSGNRLKMDFTSRSNLAKNELSKKLLQLMDAKKSTLCLAADLTHSEAILKLANIAGPHIVVLKIHVDIIDDFNANFIDHLKLLATRHKFFIMEDRKFADIGNTVFLQYSKGLYKISEWADLITVHPVPGHGVIDGIKSALNNVSEPRGIFLVTEMSSKGALTTGDYVKESLALPILRPDLIVGHVCQSNIFSDPGLIQLTPGVSVKKEKDTLGQQYNTPEDVVLNAGADLVVVGRAITQAVDKLESILMYKNELWSAYKKRTG